MSRMSTPEEVRQSILDLRRIYSGLSDERFVAWYSHKYGVPKDAIKKVLQSNVNNVSGLKMKTKSNSEP